MHHSKPHNNVCSCTITNSNDVFDAKLVKDSDKVFTHHLNKKRMLSSFFIENYVYAFFALTCNLGKVKSSGKSAAPSSCPGTSIWRKIARFLISSKDSCSKYFWKDGSVPRKKLLFWSLTLSTLQKSLFGAILVTYKMEIFLKFIQKKMKTFMFNEKCIFFCSSRFLYVETNKCNHIFMA